MPELPAIPEAAHHSILLLPLIFLAAAAIAVPIFQRLRLGSVLGYLAAGIVIGPYGAGFFNDPESVFSLGELGVVMLLFIIGLELKPSRLWSMRNDILGLGVAQMLLCGAALGLGAWMLIGLKPQGAIIAGLGLALSSTAFASPMLQQRGELTSPYGQRALAILLLQDVAIVPLLALVAVFAPGAREVGGLLQTLAVLAAVAFVVLFARFALNPLFRIMANSNAHEIMTATALLVVLGAATLMQLVGLSMAMGAFLAGVMLAESNFRHELEADIEPFRGLLLGLFFITVGMTIDLRFVWAHVTTVAIGVAALVAIKFFIISALSRLTRSPAGDAWRIGGVLAQGGEFAFVLFAAAAQARVMRNADADLLVAIVTLSLALTPAVFALARYLAKRNAPIMPDADFSDAHGTVLLIGFGRFGQIVAQLLLARGIDVTAIDRDTDAIQAATRFGFQVYYGDGTRLDVLRSAGAERAQLIAICIDHKRSTTKIVEIVKEHFAEAKLYVRANDRRHALDLMAQDIDFQIRETFASAMEFGVAALKGLGTSDETAEAIEVDMRKRDAERFERQRAEGFQGGRDLMHTRPVVQPEPLTAPKREGRLINVDGAKEAEQEDEVSPS